jgi:hypothetical protein
MLAMFLDGSVLYEQFVAARLKAMELTDRYRQTPSDDPTRALIWDDVMRQTELARGLLESLLHTEPAHTPAAVAADA